MITDPEGHIVGTVGIKLHDGKNGEIGYWVNPDHAGVMSYAVGLLCEKALLAGFSSLYAFVKPENPASIRVLEKNQFLLATGLPNQRENVQGYQKILEA